MDAKTSGNHMISVEAKPESISIDTVPGLLPSWWTCRMISAPRVECSTAQGSIFRSRRPLSGQRLELSQPFGRRGSVSSTSRWGSTLISPTSGPLTPQTE
jgi:hypothetical protein